MRTAELQIGDLVCLKDDTKYKLPLRVDGILKDDVSLEGDGFLGGVYGLIRPIPLTPEILEKNEWHLDPILKCYSDTPPWLYEEGGKEELLLRFSTKESTGALGIFDGQKIRTVSDFLWKGTLYVHELQHVMRLCGFNGLADKFKV